MNDKTETSRTYSWWALPLGLRKHPRDHVQTQEKFVSQTVAGVLLSMHAAGWTRVGLVKCGNFILIR